MLYYLFSLMAYLLYATIPCYWILTCSLGEAGEKAWAVRIQQHLVPNMGLEHMILRLRVSLQAMVQLTIILTSSLLSHEVEDILKPATELRYCLWTIFFYCLLFKKWTVHHEIRWFFTPFMITNLMEFKCCFHSAFV